MKSSLIYVIVCAFLFLSVAGCVSFDAEDVRRTQVRDFTAETMRMESELLAGPLSLDACIRVAMTNNYEVRFADLDRQLGKIARSLSFSAFLPQISASVGYVSYEKDPVTTSSNFDHGSLDAGFPIFMPSSWFLFSAAKHGKISVDIAAAYVRQSIVLKVTSRYYGVAVQENLLAALEAQVKAARETASRVRSMANEGLAREWESGLAEYMAASKTAEYEKATRDLNVMRGELCHEIGLSPSSASKIVLDRESFNAEIKIPEGSLDEIVLQALEVHPELSLADRAVVMKEDEVRKAFCNFIPTVTLFSSEAFTGNKVMNPPSANLSLGFNAAWSVFTGFYNTALYKQAKVEKKRSEFDRENTFLSIITRVVSADAALRDAIDSARLADDAYSVALAKWKEYEARSNEGLIPLNDALDAKAELDVAEVNKIRGEFAARIAAANLELAMGVIKIPGGPEQNDTQLIVEAGNAVTSAADAE